ncbi:hypothetical protein D3C86_1552000 [compost metagenome]
MLSFGFISIVVVSNAVLWLFLREATRSTRYSFNVARVHLKSSESLNYIVTYIIPFLSFNFGQPKDLAAIVILLFVMALLYTHSNLIYTNPVLTLFGYIAYGVEAGNGSSIVLLSRRGRPKPGESYLAVHLVEDIYLEAPCPSHPIT